MNAYGRVDTLFEGMAAMMIAPPVLLEVTHLTEEKDSDETATLEEIALSLQRIEASLASRQRELKLLESINASLNSYTINMILGVFFLLAFGTLALYFFSDRLFSIMQVMRDLPLVTR